MRTIKQVILLLILSVLTVCCNNGDSKVVKIGVVSPMTGAGAACVDYWVNGFNMAIEKINAENNEVKYEMIFEDCQSDPATAVSCYKRLEMQGVKYIVGLGGQFAMAIAPMTKGKDIIYFTTADYNEKVLETTDCAFRVYPSAKALGKITSDFFVNNLGINEVATITMNTVPCLQTTNAFRDNIKVLGGNVTFQDTYDIGSYDFKNTISKMQNDMFGGIFMNGFGISPAAFCAQIANNNKFDGLTFIGDVNLSTKNFINNKKNDKLKIYFADAKMSDAFEMKYQQRYNEKANSYAGCAYLIPFIIDKARNSVEDVNNISQQRDFLRGQKIETEVTCISFDNKGNGEMEMAIQELQ